MPKMQGSMVHPHRSAPYESFTEVPPVPVQNSQDYTPSTQSYERTSTAWTPEDDQRLMQFRTQGLHWGPIANNFHNKTANACRKRHERLMEKKNAESWDDTLRIEDLSKAYLEVREQMWKILADVLGEKWSTVEIKCMEKGLKTLQTAGRAARRHALIRENTPPVSRSASEFDDHSGMGLPIDQSPEGSISAAGSMIPNHMTAYHYPNPLPSQRQSSISSNSSIVNVSMVQQMPMPAYANYSPAQQIYTTNVSASPSYTATTFNMSPNNYATYSHPSHLPSLNRNYEAVPISRDSPHSVHALPPLLATARHHREPISASY